MATKFKIFISTALLLLPSLAFARVGAQATADVNANAQVNLGLNFCSNISKVTEQINTRLNASVDNLSGRQEERLKNVADRQEKRAAQLVTLRAKEDADRQAVYAKLTAKATTDAQKTAVINFQTTIEAAVKLRRSAVDAAIAAYWSGLNDALTKRQAQVQSARQKFVTAMQTALTTAQSQCTGGTASATVRANFSASVQAAIKQFNTDRQSIDKFGPQIKVLVQSRNQAIKNAVSAFKTTAEKARADLKVAFAGTATAE